MKLKLSQKGFSLIEVMVTLPVATLLLFSLFSLSIELFKNSAAAGVKYDLGKDALRFLDFISSQVQTSGGSSVRPWAALVVENNCIAKAGLPDCKGSDRLTIMTAFNPPVENKVLAMPNASTLTFSLIPDGAGWKCPITDDWKNQVIILTSGKSHLHRYVRSVSSSPVICQVTIEPLRIHGQDMDPYAINWAGTTVSVVNAVTYFLDVDNHEFKQIINSNNSAVAQANDITSLAVGVYDFQIALGYDMGAGFVCTSATQANDCWIYDVPVAQEVYTASYELWDHLRLIQIGAIFGTTAVGRDSRNLFSASLLDGPVRSETGTYLRSFRVQSAPRATLR